MRSTKLAVEAAAGVEVLADHDLLTWLVSHATGMHCRFSGGSRRQDSMRRKFGKACCSPLAQFGERVWWMPRLGSHPTVVRTFWSLGLSKEGTCWHRKWSGESPNNQTFAAGRTTGGQLVGRSTGSELAPHALEDDGGRVGIRAPVVQPHVTVPHPTGA